ncbi:MAG TPA: DUF488 domain-containing protein, partial [Pyrinomonadaceae bacterium]|nr:DUF488 domain-containing protein [Pyrinomonadaceae bacterium]
TIGHSTRPIDEFIEILEANNVQVLADVRTVPRSRHNPQFNKDELPGSLAEASIDYQHLSELGGLRHTRKDSINTGWRNNSFRGYADYMQTPEFAAAVAGLIDLAKQKQVAIMCAEAVPWRCHRSLIGDALLVRGVRVDDIYDLTHRRPHQLTAFAKVDETTITYPPGDDDAQ